MDFLWDCLVTWFKAGVGGILVGGFLLLSGIVAVLVKEKM